MIKLPVDIAGGFFMRVSFILVGLVISLAACTDQSVDPITVEDRLQQRVDALVAGNDALPGAAVWIIPGDGDAAFGAAAGIATPDGSAFTTATPVRIASNTKTYVAATYLRLFEQGLAPLDTPIAELIDADYNTLLTGDGYATDVITPRHLLMHVSGMAEHVSGGYLGAVFAEPGRAWSRDEQVAMLVRDADPLGEPGAAFAYSDTGYILIGHIIERLTGASLADTVRTQLDLDARDVDATWWEILEEPRAGRAHQYLEGTDTHAWHASIDLHGGGGLVASMQDLAHFHAALMRGDVFAEADTLTLMMSAPGQASPESYRIGLQTNPVAGMEAFSHSGFWGTYVVYVPELDLVVSGAVLEASAYPQLVELVADVVEERADQD